MIFFFKEHEKPNVTFFIPHVFLVFELKLKDLERLERQQKQLVVPRLPISHIFCGVVQMRQCCNSAPSKDASGATARLVAGGRVLIIRANAGPCLCPQFWSLISLWLPLFTYIGASSLRKWSVICKPAVNLLGHSHQFMICMVSTSLYSATFLKNIFQ